MPEPVRRVLPNGLTLLLESDPAAPTVAAGYFVNTGARDELPGEMGASHFIEHLLFKGSEAVGAAGLKVLFDLGVSRRYDYYTGLPFRVYAAGLNQPVLGGGRYALPGGLPGAGFAVGLERLSRALPPGGGEVPETVLALDLAAAQAARARGLRAELAWTEDPAELRRYAEARGIRRWVRGAGLEEAGLPATVGGAGADQFGGGA